MSHQKEVFVTSQPPLTPEERCLLINEQSAPNLYIGERREVHPDSNVPWRIAPEPYWITPDEYAWFEALGHHLLAFYEACQHLYSQSIRGVQPEWVAEYLDRGKDDLVRMYGRMRRFRSQLPLVIRPDVLPTDEGMVISELDSVPGGIGFTAHQSRLYAQFGDCIVGGAEGLDEGLRAEAALVLSFGAVTWPHLLMRAMLAEQIYRAQQILARHPYHRRRVGGRNCPKEV